MSTPTVISVVVPTRDRPDALRRCLAALTGQTVDVEVIVSEDRDGSGPAAARNAGARRAGGDVVLFTDDDCEPDPDWAELLAGACPEGGAAAGETLNTLEDDPFAAASQLLTSELQRASLREDGTLGFAPTSNLGVSRKLLARAPFDESYPTAAGEDREWCARIVAGGAALRYQPAAIVRHRQRLGLTGFWRQQVRYGRGAARHAIAGGNLAGAGARRRLIRAAFARGLVVGLLALLAQLAVAAGFAGERLRPQR
jgi:glycosyltransferase involved in cell wall biosynthesis